MKPKPVRLGIIGVEGYAFQLIKRLRTIPHSGVLLAAASLNSASIEAEYCEAYGVRIFSTVKDLLDFAPGNLDAILNPTPIHIHRETALRCLEAGLPVWLEKPPTATVAELDELIAAASRLSLPVHVCFNSLYSYRVQELKAELLAGIYGLVRRVRGIGAWSRSQEYFDRSGWAGRLKSGDTWIYDGTINNPLAHLVCNNLYFAGCQQHGLAEPATVEARLWRANPIESEDTSSLRIRTRDGIEILSHLTLCPDDGDITPLTVIDTDLATITLSDFQNVEIVWHNGKRELREAFKENRIEMLEFLCRQFHTGEPALCPLAITRPFMQTVNLAFDQVLAEHGGAIPAVRGELVKRIPSGDSTAAAINGINARMIEAHHYGQLVDLQN